MSLSLMWKLRAFHPTIELTSLSSGVSSTICNACTPRYCLNHHRLHPKQTVISHDSSPAFPVDKCPTPRSSHFRSTSNTKFQVALKVIPKQRLPLPLAQQGSPPPCSTPFSPAPSRWVCAIRNSPLFYRPSCTCRMSFGSNPLKPEFRLGWVPPWR